MVSEMLNVNNLSCLVNGGDTPCRCQAIQLRGNVIGIDFYWRCFYPPKFHAKFFFRRLLPSSGADDRAQWADRFGIDTSVGCYDTFSENLYEAAPELLKQEDKWLPVEKMMLETILNNWKAEDPEWVSEVREENKKERLESERSK